MPPDYQPLNVADRLTHAAANAPDLVAVARAVGSRYTTCNFAELGADAMALARGLVDIGVRAGDRIVLLVPPGVELVKLMFALLRTGAVAVLIDPGMGRKHLVDCLAAAEPDGFISIGRVQAIRTLLRRRFPKVTKNVTVGRRWFWGGATYKRVLRAGRRSTSRLPPTGARDAAAIIFTSGSTGPPKGVLYTHQMFDTQAAEIQRAYGLQPGGVDLACFALFGLFNSAMGVTTVFPAMNFSRPAAADPKKLLAAAHDWKVTQAFASPAVWDKLSRHCESTGERIPSLRKVFSCGAPVPASVLTRTLKKVHLDAEMHTPYGATEALPVATIEASEVLSETAALTADGAGVCVGRRFETVDWQIIRITDQPIATIKGAEALPAGEIGELIVRGPQVSPAYVIALQPRPPAGGRSVAHDQAAIAPEPRAKPAVESTNAFAKIRDDDTVWHRMGDVGYLDEHGRFWYCGRKSHRVETAAGTLYTECVEPIFNADPAIRRTALVGVGPRGKQIPCIIFEPAGSTENNATITSRLVELAMHRDHTRAIRHFLPYDHFPVDVRHNSKINREQLAAWAAKRVDTRETNVTDAARISPPSAPVTHH